MITPRLLELARLLRPYRTSVAMTVVAGIANAGGLVVAAALVAWWAAGTAVGDPPPGPVVLGAAAGAVAVSAVGRYIEVWVEHDVAYRLLADLRQRLYTALERTAPRGLEDRRAGDVVATAMGDVETLELFFAHTAPTLFSALAVPVLALAALAGLHPLLALALAPFVVVVCALPFLVVPRTAARSAEVRGALGAVNADAVDAVQGLREVLAARAGSRWALRLGRRDDALTAASTTLAGTVGATRAATDAAAGLGLVTVVAVAAALSASGALAPVAAAPAAVIAAGAFPALVAFTGTVGGRLSLVTAAAERLATLLDSPPNVVERDDAKDPGAVAGVVAFERVSFRYDGQAPALDDVSFEATAGETVALVGHSGAGKSTCGRLLLRLADPDTGTVRIGGHDLREVEQDAVRRMVAAVPQDVFLFRVGVRENVRVARPDATDDEVAAACRLACADDFVRALPDGYDTVLGERGATLSGGQRQRLALARALLVDAPVLLLDEAVSNVDEAAEREVTTALRAAARARTTIVIAHRLATVAAADRVVVLERGRVVETGSPAALAAGDGPYARLLAAQLSPPSPALTRSTT